MQTELDYQFSKHGSGNGPRLQLTHDSNEYWNHLYDSLHWIYADKVIEEGIVMFFSGVV